METFLYELIDLFFCYICDYEFPFWAPRLPKRVRSNSPCQFVGPWSFGLWSVRQSLNISETALRIFLIFCMKLGHHKGTKVTEPDF